MNKFNIKVDNAWTKQLIIEITDNFFVLKFKTIKYFLKFIQNDLNLKKALNFE